MGDEPKGAPLWMCTFSDMMSLLLCFFVLLFALSTTEKKKWVQASGAMTAAFGGKIADYEENMPTQVDPREEISRPPPPKPNKNYGKTDIVSRLKLETRTWKLDENQMEILGTAKGIKFVLTGGALFNEKEATIRPEAHRMLQKIASDIVSLPSNPVRIVGHTDDQSTEGTEFASNWELSLARGRSVMTYMNVQLGVPEGRFRFMGCADTQPRLKRKKNRFGDIEVYSNAIAVERPMNNRIEVILLQTDENEKHGWYAEFKEQQGQSEVGMEPFDEPI